MTQTTGHTIRFFRGASLGKPRQLMAGRRFCLRWAGLAAMGLLALAGRLSAETPLPTATNLWSLKLGEIGTAKSSPAIAPDGTIYQATFYGTLLAIAPEGRVIWTFDTGKETEIKSSPAIADDGTIYFGSRNRKLYAVTPAGKLKWTFATGAWVDSTPAIAADGTIYFGSWDKNFYALDPAGTQKWKFATGGAVVSSPAIAADGTIYFGAMDKNFYALSPDGKLKWTLVTGGEISSSPAIGPDGTIYLTSTDGNLYALKTDGTEIWRLHTGGFNESSPVVDANGNIYVAATHDEYSISKEGRHIAGSGLACWVDATAVAVAGQTYWSRPWRTLQAHDENGQVFWTANTTLNLSASPVVGTDGIVYATCGTLLHAIRPPGDPLPLANSSWPMFHADPRHTGRVRSQPAH